jgi:succinylarginine dihydrolase
MEINFDGLVGPSHNYGGLSFGNLASQASEGSLSNPRQAALQGLAKMRALRELGVPQALLPPHPRPDLELARRIGYRGTDEQVLVQLAGEAPLVLAACYSASAMWTANAATVAPSVDAADDRVHVTPANLQNKVHRCIEAPVTARILQRVFEGDPFVHHPPLPGTAALGDEGAANHTRFCVEDEGPGLHLFVYGESAINPWDPKPKVFPARQTREASEAVARLHQLPAEATLFVQQNPEVIDQGVFHNDVISVGHRDVYLVHETAFIDTATVLDALRRRFADRCRGELRTIVVPESEVSVPDAVSSYLFNSQLVTVTGDRIALVAPMECRENERVRGYIESVVGTGTGIDEVHYFDLRQSMQGGGGPACLRLRVSLDPHQVGCMAPGVRFTEALDARLVDWVTQTYRDRLSPSDLSDPQFVRAGLEALDELTRILDLGAIYRFQN